MGRSKNYGRAISGMLLLDKPKGMSSNGALQRCKRLFKANKAGHTGSLDPMATGVLPICFGEATKFSQYLLDADKHYIARVRLGVTTRSGDAEGELLGEQDASYVTDGLLAEKIADFRGDIRQIPSMFSALKYQGTPLYELARQGVEIERPARPITIYYLEVSAIEIVDGYAEFTMEVHCSKGTYIRTLAEDIGLALGCGAHINALRRTKAGQFELSNTVTLDEIEQFLEAGNPVDGLDQHLLPVDSMLQQFPQVQLNDDCCRYFRLGQQVMHTEVYRFAEESAIVRVLTEAGEFLGLGEVVEGCVAPRRLIAQHL